MIQFRCLTAQAAELDDECACFTLNITHDVMPSDIGFLIVEQGALLEGGWLALAGSKRMICQ